MSRGTSVLVVCCFCFTASLGQATLSQSLADISFQSGADRIKHQQYGSAYDAFSRFLDDAPVTDPRRIEAEYYRAYCAVTLLNPAGEEQLGTFVERHPNHPKALVAYYELANHFYNEKNYPKASLHFSKVNFKSLPDDYAATGRFRWGYSLFSQRNMVNALDQFNAIKALGGTYGPAASYYAGFIELSAGDYDNAILDLQRAEKNESYATVVPPLIATAYQRQGKDDELIRYAEPLLSREDLATDELSLLIAEAWFRKKNYSKALSAYTEYLDEHESAARSVYYRAGFAAWSSSNDTLTVKYLNQAASDKDSVGLYASYLLGSVYLKRHEKVLALTAFGVARNFKDNPRIAEESLLLSAKINYDLGRPDIAIREFESVLELYPQSSHTQEIKELLAQAYINANNVNKAIAYIEALSHRTPPVDRAYQKATYLKGTEYFNKEDYAQAATQFRKSLEVPLDHRIVAEASYWLAETYSVGKRWEEAVPHYEKALSSDGLTTEMAVAMRYGLGYARYNLQQYDKAFISFRDFASRGQRSPNYSDGLLRMADCQYVLKAYSESVTTYRRVIDLKSVDSEYARLQCGKIMSILRRYDEAENELSIVSRTASRFADEARFQLGQVDLARGNYPSAVKNFSVLLSTSPDSRFAPFAYSRRAAANYNLKNYSQTADDYIAVVEKYPAHPAGVDVLLLLQEALRLAGRTEEFEKYLALYKQANPDARGIESVEFETAKSHYFSQHYDKAKDALAALLRNYPESVHATEARYYEAESYYRLKDMEKSLELHKQVSSDPAFALVTRSVGRVGEIEFKLQRYESAVAAYGRLAAIASNKKDAFTALNGLMETYYLLASYDSCERYARKVQELGSVGINAAGKASLFLGKCSRARGDYDTAKDEFLTTINAAQDEYGAEAKYLLAEIFFLQGNHTMCRETLISLNHDFAPYEAWVGKSFLLLAEDYMATQEVFQAKGTLRSLIDNFPKADVRERAAERLKAIEASEQMQKFIRNDSTERKP